MTQLALFAEPVRPGEHPVLVDGRWNEIVTPGAYIRQLKIKHANGPVAVVVPTNFVDEKWPWTGRSLAVAELRAKWLPQLPRTRNP